MAKMSSGLGSQNGRRVDGQNGCGLDGQNGFWVGALVDHNGLRVGLPE